MFRDNRDDFDNNEDVDLNGMLHQYDEDNELRRKINELKKQKEEQKGQNTSFDPTDSAFVKPSTATNSTADSRIPDIRVDDELEKTRVGFSDDRDKTLVIMDRMNKTEPARQNIYEESSQETKSNSALHNDEFEPEEDIRETIRKKRKASEVEEVDDEKTKKVNKVITYVIIGILGVALLVGAGFGIKYMFFNSSSSTDDKKTEEKDNKKDNGETTNNDKPSENTPSSDDEDITDNSAIIKQLRTQIETYEGQLKEVNDDITTVESAKKTAEDAVNNIATLFSNAKSLLGQMQDIAGSEEIVKNAYNEACKVDKTLQTCKDAQTQYETYTKLQSQYTLAQQQYDAEAAKDATYRGQVSDAKTKLNTLSTKKISLEKQIADKTTELAKYE